MSDSFKGSIPCPACSSIQETEVYSSVNVTVDPKLKKLFFDKKINWATCPICGFVGFIPVEFVYHDMDKKFLVIFKNQNSISENTEEALREFSDRLDPGGYLSYPIIVHDPRALLLAVAYCDESGAPHSKKEADNLAQMCDEQFVNQDIPVLKHCEISDSINKTESKVKTKGAWFSSVINILSVVFFVCIILIVSYWLIWGRILIIQTHGEPLGNFVNLSYFEVLHPDMSRTEISQKMGQPTRVDVPYVEKNGPEIDYAEIRWIYERPGAQLNYYVEEEDIPGGSVEYLAENMKVGDLFYKEPNSLLGRWFIEIRDGEKELMFIRLRGDDTIKKINWYNDN